MGRCTENPAERPQDSHSSLLNPTAPPTSASPGDADPDRATTTLCSARWHFLCHSAPSWMNSAQAAEQGDWGATNVCNPPGLPTQAELVPIMLRKLKITRGSVVLSPFLK